jgi:hypothetical protein
VSRATSEALANSISIFSSSANGRACRMALSR